MQSKVHEVARAIGFCCPRKFGRPQKSMVCPTVALLALLAACSSKPAAKPIVVPEVYRVKFETSKGDFVVEVTKAWAPRGADHFHELLRMRYYDESRFFRVLPGFIAQFGINKDFDVHAKWRELVIADDPQKDKNLRGTLAFAQSGPNTRATEVFINLKDNPDLDEDRFVPFGKVVEGMDVVDMFYSGYGELGPKGKGPDAGRAESEANEYMAPRFPNLDYIKRARLIE
jgi:peptidyl-prolyl cis-trans isomerase A (cyclophilin A)